MSTEIATGRGFVASSRYILPAERGPGRAVPMSLEGYPSEIEGQPVQYRRKEVSRAGRTVQDDKGNPFPITRERLEKWAVNTNKLIERGVKVFIPTKHTEILSSDNRGFVVAMDRDGDSLYATEQLIGEDAILDASRNDQSTYVMLDVTDDQGNHYDEVIQHIALTPCPAVSGLNGFAKVAASRGADAEAVILFATPEIRSVPMSFQLKKETAVKLRTKLGVADDVGDEKLAEQAFDTFLAAQEPAKPDAAQTAAMSKLEADNKALKEAAEKAEAKVVSMSRLAPPKIDDDTAFLVGESIATKRDIAVNNGAVSPACAKELDKLFADGDKPSVVAMSRPPGSSKPLAMRVWEALADNKPQALGEKTGRQTTISMSRLTEGGEADLEGTPEEQEALRKRVAARMGKQPQTAGAK